MIATAVLVLLACASAPAGELLTLERAVELALESNLSLEAARHDYEAARWGLRGSWASLFPAVRLSSTARRIDEESFRRSNASIDAIGEIFQVDIEPFVYETTYETMFTGSMPIWNGGRLWGAIGAAAAGRDAAMYAHESRSRAIEVEAQRAYLDVLRAEDLLAVSRDAAAAARRNLEAAERRLDIGLAGRAEYLRWRVQRTDAIKELGDAELAVHMARTQLAQVLGLPMDAEPELVPVARTELDPHIDAFSWALGPETVTEERARELLADNPDYLAIAATARIERSNLTIARGAFLPSLNASGSYGWKADDDIEPDDDTAWSVTLALDLPVFTSFQNLSQYQSSKRAYLAALRRREDAERSMVAAVRNAVGSLRTSLKGLQAAEAMLEQAEELLKNVTGRYDQGMVPYTEFVDTRVLYDRSRAGYINALYDAFLTFAEAERLIGGRPTTEPGEQP
jgi:multidrug efflux system outer membrane protein